MRASIFDNLFVVEMANNHWGDVDRGLKIISDYANVVRTFERHIDVDAGGISVSPYCSLPEQVDIWFKAFRKAEEMCGGSAAAKRVPPEKGVRYLDGLVRGVYAKRDLSAGHILADDDVYLAVPLQKGQISCREMMKGEVLINAVSKDEAVAFKNIDSPYGANSALAKMIEQRGIDSEPKAPANNVVRLV